ncbi:MAG: DEAD/DEAH box helicase [Chloroflexi bacterium]|nr:DEAD/DEAH box helicase [Chloroflexota bacterium]
MSQTFAELGLNPELIKELETLGYEKPTKLQADLTPHFLAGRDIIAVAPPGSGKAIAYVLPILQTLDLEKEGVQVLVLVQSGTEARRVAMLFRQLSQHPNFSVTPVYGEQPIAREAERLSRPNTVVIGTLKRLQEHVERESFAMEHVQFMVLDGVDQLLARGRSEKIGDLLDQLPAGRQSAMLANQLSPELQVMADDHLFEPVVLERQANAVPMPLIKHRYQSVPSGEKLETLVRLLDGESVQRGLVYVNLRPDVQQVALMLAAEGYTTAALHGASPETERDSVMRKWQEGSLDFIILTDPAAQALTLETETAVSYDMPTDAELYAQRAQTVVENGMLYALVSPSERPLLSEIENLLGQRVKAVLPTTRASVVAQRAESFRQKLRTIIDRTNLETYLLLLNDMAEEGYDWSEIAAAAVSMTQHGVPTEKVFQGRPNRRQSSAPPRREPRERRSPGRERGRQREHDEDREVEEGYIRLVMDAGYDIGVRPKDIVGAIANEANIPGRAVGNIDIRDSLTFVEVQQDYYERVLTRVPSTRLRGRIVTFRRA